MKKDKTMTATQKKAAKEFRKARKSARGRGWSSND